jgi:hypothetical protein
MADITLKVTSFSPVAIYKLKGQDEQEKCGLCNNNLLDQSVADKEKFDSESKIIQFVQFVIHHGNIIMSNYSNNL